MTWRRRKTRLVISVSFFLATLGVLQAYLGLLLAQDIQSKEVRLVLLLVVDQARYEYSERLRPLFRQGLKRLLDNGVSFIDAHQNHAVTTTGPGHASLVTGAYPRRSGIVNNNWFDRVQVRTAYSVEDPEFSLLPLDKGGQPSSPGRSPRNLLVTALPDWIKTQDPDSKTFAVSRKDRAAILLAGKHPDGAFWYDPETGNLITSRYYMLEYPSWVQDFQQQRIPDRLFGKAWEALPVEEDRLRDAAIEAVDEGLFQRSFPHPLGHPSLLSAKSFYSDFGSTPFMDDYLVDFALRLIDKEELGWDDSVDYLGIGFSVLDSVGHSYGPNSRECLDVWLRLDRSLGKLLDHLEKRIGLDRVIIALSADHGVLTLPEYRTTKGLTGGRIGVEDVLCLQNVMSRFQKRFGQDNWFLSDLYLNYETVRRHNLSPERVERELASLIEQCPSVAHVWTRAQLEVEPEDPEPFRQLYAHSFHPERSPDLYIQLEKFHLGSLGRGTSHGSPYVYDTHVPLLLLLPGAKGRQLATPRIHTVDLAPTLAGLLGVPVPVDLDGKDRRDLFMDEGGN